MDLEKRKRRLLERESALLNPFGTPVYAFREAGLRKNYRRDRASLDDSYPDSWSTSR